MTQFPNYATTLIHQRGGRMTPQRQLILEAIQAEGHCTPDDIYQRIRLKFRTLNRATVYRNLDFLCDMRLVVAVKIGRHMYYESAAATPHHHFVCRQCNTVAVLSHADVKPFFDQIEREQGYLIDMEHLALFGLCQKCRSVQVPAVNTHVKNDPKQKSGGKTV